MSKATRHEAPFFATAIGMVVAGLLLFVVSVVLALLANIALAESDAGSLSESNRLLATYGSYLLSVLVALMGLATLIAGSVRWGMHGRHATAQGRGAGGSESAVEIELLEAINARLSVSETAKRLAFRDEDIALIQRTIDQDIRRGQFDAALSLVEELSGVYGQVESAEAFREKIQQLRRSAADAAVRKSLEKLKQIVANHDFEAATLEARKIQRLFPESETAREATRRVEQAREQYKLDLERRFLAAAEHGDVDLAMDLLKEMDRYLTETEAAPLLETARGVVGKARDNLGVQFKLAMADREWVVAVSVGEQILREFPNSKMANEVRGILDVLRERAAGQQAASPQGAATS